jgi:stress response protein YsnF
MAKRANRGCGGKKVTKLMLKEASADLEVSSRSLNYDNCEVELSEEEETCENLAVVCEDVDSSKLAAQRLVVENNSVLRKEDMEVSSSFPEVGMVESSIKVDQKSVTHD